MSIFASTAGTFLDSLVVVELGSRPGVGALGGLLAQLGAEVVVVEPKQRSYKGKWRNRPITMAGKQSIVIGDASLAARDALNAVFARADVLLLSSDVDVEQYRLWVDERRQSLIICDMTAFGHTGPLAGKAMSEALVQAMSGVLDTTGLPDRPPSAIGTPLLEMHAAVLAATAILAAIRIRDKHGPGQRIDIALFDVGVTALINFIPLQLVGRAASRCGNRHPLYGSWGAFPAKDGWILICAAVDDQWSRLCDAMGRPELASDPRFSTTAGRLDSFQTVHAIINLWTSGLLVAECEEQLLARGVVCGPVVELDDLDKQGNLEYRCGILDAVDPESGAPIKLPNSPLRGFPISGKSSTLIPHGSKRTGQVDAPRGEERIISGDETLPFRPYDGIRIVEIGVFTVAPLASRMMGAMGADVIKVEPPAGDAIRKAAPLRSDGQSYIFAMTNTDKRGVVLDLRVAADQDRLHKLLDKSDALIENLKPGSLAKLGFGRATIRDRHPHLIYCSVNGFGEQSIYPGRPALDTVVQAMSGLMDITRVEEMPMKAGISASDNLGGQFALLSLAAAIHFRERTTESVHFDLSMQEASAWATQFEWNQAPKGLEPALIKTKDGYVAVEAEEKVVRQFLASEGVLAESEIRAHVVEALDAKFPSAPVLTVGDVVGHAQTAARRLLLERSTCDGDAWLVLSTPFKMNSTSVEVRSVISGLGVGDSQVYDDVGLTQPHVQRI